ncbi:MAG: DUF1080 domain-containing protein [Planctomycetaceae bacterium]|nr:MAG: DUF1080 domain-containing protein [Planctomycetaceae bacterium]
MTQRPNTIWLTALTICLGIGVLGAAHLAAAQENPVWTDPNDPTLPADVRIQGEYAGEDPEGQRLGCQVIALGSGKFHAVVYPGGLPGDGWDGQNKSLMDGRMDDQKAVFVPAEGPKQYLAGPPAEFSATRQFPPAGHQPYTAVIEAEKLTGKTEQGQSFELTKVHRQSPTLGKEPPESAVVLFDGSDKDAWRGGRLDEQTGLLNTDGNDIRSRERFQNYSVHLEFMLPYRPYARGQGRGNSGFYQVDHYEVQILDSFGLEGLHNECGGIYAQQDCLINACLPPLVWQTFDIDFTNAQRDQDGNKTKNAVITVRLNGIVIHDQLEIQGPTGGHRSEPEGTPGPLKLQGHGNPLQFRNIWLVPQDG